MEKPVVIVAGASRGIGAAIACELAKLGARVVMTARSLDALEAEAKKVRELGAEVLVIKADATREADCQQVVKETIARFGRIDALVNNMGKIEPIAPIAKANSSEWMANLAVNLLAPVLMIQAALPPMRETQGRIINVSSGAADKAYPGWAAYCSAKSGLNMMTQGLAIEEPAITCLAVKPGIVDTEMQKVVRAQGQNGMPDDLYSFFVGLHEKGKLLPPEVPGRAIARLALETPHDWSGQFLAWNDEKVKALLA